MLQIATQEPKSLHPQLDKIARQLIEHTDEAANLKKFGPALDRLTAYEQDSDQERSLLAATAELAGLSPEEKMQLAHGLAVKRIVLNAISNMYRTMQTPGPEERFRAYFTSGLLNLDGTPKSEAEQKAFLGVLKEAQEKMVLSVVQTMHPTIYHSAFARDYETRLTEKLEGVAVNYRSADPKDRFKMDRRAADPVSEARQLVTKMIEQVNAGQKITPDLQVTVADENTLDHNNHIKMQNAFSEVVKGYNDALKDVANDLQIAGKLAPASADAMRASKIDESRAVWRTWAYGADADGRDLSTSIVLYDGIHHQVQHDESGHEIYISRERDLRENAKDQKQSVSCLIQRAFWKDGFFRDFCTDFMQHAEPGKGERIGWVDPKKSTVLQLSESEQASLFRKMIVGDYNGMTGELTREHFRLVPKSLEEQTIAFNGMFRSKYREFLKSEGIGTEGPLPDLASLTPGQQAKLKDIVEKTYVECGKRRESIQFEINTTDKLYAPKSGDNLDFFKTGHKTVIGEGGKVELKELSGGERRKLLDVIKRLQVLNNAIDKFGDAVADRYQIANFANASDFYSTLLLFRETGIIDIENGKVRGKPKLSIQPLLETKEDQENAIPLFKRLLEDPLVLSYYQGLGNRAELMVGYSDGAKSAGNFASEWSIYKCTRELKDVFARKGIKVTFFQGRGRGDNRGGQFDEGQNYRMSPFELHEDMRYDETQQSCGPLAGAMSKARGEDTLTSVITGVITAKREAEEEKARRKDPQYVAWMDSLDKALDGIAETSSREYLRLVAEKPNVDQTEKLLNAVPNNPFISSRKASRGSQHFDDMRAITVEYGFNAADAPLHYLGLNTALKKFMSDAENGGLADKDGRTFKGAHALELLYDSHPAFRNMMDKMERGLVDFDPAVFRGYAKVAGVEPWAEECIGELTGLRELIESIRTRAATREEYAAALQSGKRWTAGEERPRTIMGKVGINEIRPRLALQHAYNEGAADPLRQQNVGLDKAAHALALSGAWKEGRIQPITALGDNPFRPEDAQLADVTRHVAFLVGETNRRRGEIPPPAIRAAVDKVPYFAGVNR